MHTQVIIYVLVIDLLAIMSPGPDFFMVLKNSITGSHKAGLYTTIGVSLGSTLMFSLGIFGVGAIVAGSKVLFGIVKIVGATYLTYLGLKSLISRRTVVEPNIGITEGIKELDRFQYFKIGLLCNITNPKALMFIVSLSTYVVDHGNPYIDGIFIILGSLINTFIWFSLVSFIFGNVKVRQVFYRRQKIINITFGIILLYVAYKIFFI